MSTRPATTLAAIAFVLIWSTGFIVARGIRPHADPSLFLSARFGACAALFFLCTLLLSLPWPERRSCLQLLGIGAIMQGVYLGASFWVVGEGLQAGVMALFGSLQPALTALLAAHWFNEKSGPAQWLGITLGMIGVALSAWPSDTPQASDAPDAIVFAAATVSVLAITAGTLMQKSALSRVHLIPSSAIQNAGAMLVALIFALLLQERYFALNTTSLLILAYAVVVLSVGGTTLLLWMVRQGSASATTRLLFLAPPLAALLAWLLFDDGLSARQLAGFSIALAGVLLARRQAPRQ